MGRLFTRVMILMGLVALVLGAHFSPLFSVAPAYAEDISVAGGGGGGAGGQNPSNSDANYYDEVEGEAVGAGGAGGAGRIGDPNSSNDGPQGGGGGGAGAVNGVQNAVRDGKSLPDGDWQVRLAAGGQAQELGEEAGSNGKELEYYSASLFWKADGGDGGGAALTFSVDKVVDDVNILGGNGGKGGMAGVYIKAGSQGGKGGAASLKITGDLSANNVNVIAGRGGSTGLNYSATKLGGQGGVGGDASLEVSGAITANSVVVRSGSSRGDATLGDARGGAAKFLANSLSAPEIMIEKATGEVYFSVNSLKIDSDTRLYLINTSESANFGDPGVYIGEARIGDGVLAVESDNQGLGESGAYIGTLVLTGRGSFTETRLNDALSVSLGQLAIDGGVIGANNWDILGKDYANQDIELRSNGAVVYLLDGEELTIDRDLVGAGQLEKTGEGTLILSGNSNAYSGGTLISGGILKGDTLSVQGNIENNALLVFEQDFDGEFFSDISGQGSLTKSGLGTLTLSGVNTFNGLTTVQSGTLKLGADLSSSNLTLYGGATFDNSAGFTHSLDSGSLTVLVNNGQSAIYIGDLEAKNAQLRFYSTAFDPTTPLLKVMGDADISDSKFIIGLSGATVMAVGDTMTVMEVSDGQALKAENTLHRGFGEVLVGSTMFYEIAAEPEATLEEFYDDASLKLRSVMAVKATVVKGSVLDQTKALAEGWLGGLVQVQQGADLIAYQGINEAASLASAPGNAGFSAFSAVSGGSIRYNTGSHVDAKGLSLLVGLAWGTDLAPGRLTLGAFFEYGDGSYDTHNSFKNAADVDGEGDTRYAGGGVLGRFELNKSSLGSYYVEASGRAGGVRNEYKNSDLRNLAGRRAEFDTSTPYYGFHLGTGYIFSLTEATSLDVYGKYFWTSQEGESTRLSTGERLKFDDANSSRVRVGGRLSIAVNDHVAPYFGAAYEREFEGKAKATVNGFKIKEPSLRGDTGVGELGLSFKPSASVPLTLDLGAQGYVGKREGVTGSLKLKFTF